MFDEIEILDRVDSTNEYLKEFLSGGRSRLVVAREQTEGRGRFGRGWHSPRGEGLYVSYLIYPRWEVRYSGYLNRISSLAVVDAIREQGGRDLALRLKPPNDVFVGPKKVCGILTELGSTGERMNWAIIGIGMNLYQTAFPAEIDAATSLRLEGLEVANPMTFCRAQTRHLTRRLRAAGRGEWALLDEDYRRETG